MLRNLALPLASPFLPLAADAFPPVLRALMHFAPLKQRTAVWQSLAARLRWHGTRTFKTRTSFGFEMRARLVDMLGLYVYYFGVWEPSLSAWVSGQLRLGDTFVDVGANLGYYSLLASQFVGPEGRVIAIEASPRIFPQLIANIALNDARNIRAENIAVSDEDGEVDIYYGPESHSGITSLIPQNGLVRSGRVQTRPLPSILSDEELSRARLLKIDVEGAECLVVQGLRDFINRMRQDVEFVVEVSPARLRAIGQEPSELMRIFQTAGFKAYTLFNDYTPDYYLRRPGVEAPARFHGEISSEIDVIFSRRDDSHL